MSTLGISLLAAPMLLFAAPQQELTLQQVLRANTAAINAIHSLHVTIEVSNNLPVPGDEKPPTEARLTYITEWYKDVKRQRLRQIWLRGRVPHSFDAYNGPDGLKGLFNYDPNFKPPLSESISHPAYGETDKSRMMEGAFQADPRGICYMVLNKGGRNITLEEYVASYPSSKLEATPAISKLGCYEITTLEEKYTVPESKDVKDLRIFIDPKVGFWIRRIEGGPWKKSTNPGDKDMSILDVQEFKDCGNGIFWPLRASHTVRLPGAKVGIDINVRHTLHSINQPLLEGDFDIHFPDWIRVFDRPSGQITIWGPDNKPRMTFASQDEYMKWYKPRAKDPYQDVAGLPQWMRLVVVVGISILVGLMLALILWQRSRTTHRLKTVSDGPAITSPPSEPEGR